MHLNGVNAQGHDRFKALSRIIRDRDMQRKCRYRLPACLLQTDRLEARPTTQTRQCFSGTRKKPDHLWSGLMSGCSASSSSLLNRRSGTSNQMVFVDVDDFHRLIRMAERNRPVGSNGFVVVDRAFVVTVMQATWANQRINFAFIQPIDHRFHDDSDVVELCFLEERKATGGRVRQRSHDLIFTRRVDAEHVAFDRIKHRRAVVAFLSPQFVFDQLALISRNWNGRQVFSRTSYLSRQHQ